MISEDLPISKPERSAEDHEAEIARRDREIRSLSLILIGVSINLVGVASVLLGMLFRR